ncbi:FG-GAP repeat domain-containing protein [Ideonella sp. YS5]|uniref:FG-GAP repeat domain-containing protein n=1 Tax=Ideonella sp. YS5 TaxID=3453714 RepID=UPI003EEDF568
MSAFAKAVAGAVIAVQFVAAHAQYNARFIETSKAWGSAVADFNNDGHDDIFITGHDTDDRIWYWTAAGYKPSEQVLVWVDRHDCAPADFNRDGRMDLYCAVGAVKGTGEGPNEVWLQDQNGVFVLQTDHGAEDRYGSSRIPVTLDFNHDGYPDIYLTNERRDRADGNLSINRLFINQGDGAHFVEAATIATGEKGSACAVAGDVNGDGWDDLLVCDLEGPPHVYLNDQAGNFTEAYPAAVHKKWRQVQLADMNGDGKLDLVALVEGNDLEIWFNTGNGGDFPAADYSNHFSFTAKSITVGDFNRDGKPDVYAVLMNVDCPQTLSDLGADALFLGLGNGQWVKTRLNQSYAGCGHLADTVDGDKVLLMNGGISWVGPNYVLSWQPWLSTP